MTASGELQTIAFGDLVTGVWGTVLASPGQAPFVCLGVGVGADAAVSRLEARLEGSGSAPEWRLNGAGVELVITPAGEAVTGGAPESGLDGFDQLCRVTGSFQCSGSSQEVSSLGCRGAREGVEEYESLRAVSAWFAPRDGLALAAFRPRRSKGQDADVISAAVLDPEHPGAVEDPRLSTTYTDAGWPARAGLELWLASGEDEEAQPLRRAAGQAAGARLQADWGEREVRAELFRWGSRGQDGTGVYVLAAAR
jgi:hypothetical protein